MAKLEYDFSYKDRIVENLTRTIEYNKRTLKDIRECLNTGSILNSVEIRHVNYDSGIYSRWIYDLKIDRDNNTQTYERPVTNHNVIFRYLNLNVKEYVSKFYQNVDEDSPFKSSVSSSVAAKLLWIDLFKVLINAQEAHLQSIQFGSEIVDCLIPHKGISNVTNSNNQQIKKESDGKIIKIERPTIKVTRGRPIRGNSVLGRTRKIAIVSGLIINPPKFN